MHGADATNAYAEAPPPLAKLYVKINKQYWEWYRDFLGLGELDPKHILPVQHALQGHPESARLWYNHIHHILCEKLNFKSCPHEPCIYIGTIHNDKVLLLQQVDDFAISAKNEETINHLLDKIDGHLKQKLKRQGLLSSFNGINIQQTSDFIKILCEKYILKILQGHGWESLGRTPVKTPMVYNSKALNEIATTQGPTDSVEASKLQLQHKFNFCQAIGKLMFAAVTCRPDILFLTIYLSQFSCYPVSCHYFAVKRIFRYLRFTIAIGLYFWREQQQTLLPKLSKPHIPKENYNLKLPNPDHQYPWSYSDADWASNPVNRRSVSGSAVFLAGSPIIYKSKFQHCITLSSTESELYAASDTGKLVKYVRNILNFLGHHLPLPTLQYVNNEAIIAIGNNNKATKRVRYIDICYFSLLEWIQKGDLSLHFISTSDNPVDCLTKSLGTQLHTRHHTTLLGKRKPWYCKY